MRMKRRIKPLFWILLLVLTFIIIGIVIFLIINIRKNTQIEKTINDVKAHYNEFVKTNKESNLYDSDYKEVGKIGKNVELLLKNTEIGKETKYFAISDLDGYYVKYDDVDKIDSLSDNNDRYKNYILFNNNIVTKEKTTFYDENDNLIYSFNEDYSLPVVVKDTDRYGVEFNNRLLYIKASDGEIIDNVNTDKHNASGVGVFNYHAFYDENDPNDSCSTEICHSKKQFKQQLDYLKENNILTLKMNELEMYVDGKIQLPKSILLTIDDGGRDKIAVDMLTEYKMYATIFLVTGWYDPSTYYKTDYIEFHSHTDNMHNTGVCPGGQGGAIKCLSEDKIQDDLKTSRDKLSGSTYIAYPFYEYNDYSIEMLKKAGFTMAFIGESNKSDNLVHVGSDKFRLRRFVIVTYTTIKDIDEYLGQIH